MAVTLRQESLYLRDENTGTYKNPAILFSDIGETEAEVKASIRQEGSTQISAINARAVAVESSLPTSGEMEAMVAESFVSGAYSAGDYVVYNDHGVNKLYRFTADHTGAWTGTDVVQVAVCSEMSLLDGKISMSNTRISANATDIDSLETDMETAQRDIRSLDSEYIDLSVRMGMLEPAATAEDVGKALIAKTVTSGKVIEYEFGETTEIDDTAGEGDTNKTWSADKLSQIKPGLTEDAIVALLNCFAHVAWVDEHGQDYYNALENALYQSDYPKIIASLNPGVNVFFLNDTLDIVKNHITVKYCESMGSGEVIVPASQYEITGTLNVGVSVLTISYNGLITYVSVLVCNDTVPSGYTKYDYISTSSQSSDNIVATVQDALIKLGKYDNVNNIALAFDVFPTHNIFNEHRCIIGVKTENSYGSGTSIYGRGRDNACLVLSHVASNVVFDNVLTKNAVNHIELIANNGTPTTFIVGSVKNEIQWEHNDALNSYLYLFTNTWEGNTGTEYLSRYYQIGKIVLIDSNGNIDVFVPSLRTADNVVGLYNTVDDVFITCNNSDYAKIGNSSCIYKVGNWT